MPDANEKSAGPASASRIGSLATLPVFFKLGGKRVVLAGGDEAALWKAELLAATGADVEVFAETLDDGFHGLSAAPVNGRILLVGRNWTASDLADAALAVGSFADDADAEAFAAAAREAGVPVNVVDRPRFCDFQFGAIVNRSPLVVGISTDGAAPMFGQAVRSLIESLLPDGFRHWAQAARDLRRTRNTGDDTPGARRGFWQRFTDFAVRFPEKAPTDFDIEHLSQDRLPDMTGSIANIEVGESTDALTLGALRLLRTADDIFFDETVPAEVLSFARREARRHAVSPDGPDSQAVADAVSEAAESGRRVVRLRLSRGG